MRELTEDCQCAVCGKEFTQSFPEAEGRDEYAACRSKLKGGYVVDDEGKASRKIPCPDKACHGRVSVTILSRAH